MQQQLKRLALRLLPKPLRRSLMARRYEHEIAQWGEIELTQLPGLVCPSDVALDIGANLGVYTYALHKAGARVLAFEPNPWLARMIGSLGLAGVEVLQVALSANDENAELLIPVEGGGHGLATLRDEVVDGIAVERVAVPARRLDSLALAKVDFIKIDVEGHEEAVLQGAAETLARLHPTLLIEIEERHNAGGLARIAAMLEALGYRGRFFRNGEWVALEAFDLATDQRVTDDIEQVGISIARRDFAYINNFLFEPVKG